MSKLNAFVRLDFMTVKPYFTPKNLLIFAGVALFISTMGGSVSSAVQVGLMLGTIFVSYPFAVGEKNGMDALYTTLSVSRKNVVLGRYVFTLAMNLCAVVFSLLLALAGLLASRLFGNSPASSDALWATLALAAIFLIVQAMQLPIYFKLGYAKAKFLSILPFAALIAGFFAFNTIAKNSDILSRVSSQLAGLPGNGALVGVVAGFVVPNNIVGQFAAEFMQLYPSANVLMVTEKDFEKRNRRKFCARIATGDYDGVVIAHTQFEKIPMSEAWQDKFIRDQISDITDGIIEMKAEKGERVTVKAMERAKAALQARLQKLHDRSRKDDVLSFEELGVDLIFVDEADCFKNLAFVSKMRNVAGISQGDAQKASDLFMKCRYLDALTGGPDESEIRWGEEQSRSGEPFAAHGKSDKRRALRRGRGVVFATGTPVSNTMAEMFTMQRYLQYSALEARGLEHFDCWASTFGETVTAMELAPEGTGFRMKTRFSRFYNLPELMNMFREVADIQTADMLNLPTPKVRFHVVAAKSSDEQREMVQALAARAEKIRNGNIDPRIDNMLLVTNDGRKLALDQRLTNPLLPDFAVSKVNLCVENVHRIWRDTTEKRLTQLVFIDLSTPKDDAEFDVYHDIKEKLLRQGVPADDIAFIHDAKNEAQKQALFGRVRSGQVRILLGSTAKMGAGTNVQDLLVCIHDCDCPWRPRDVGQAKRTV